VSKVAIVTDTTACVPQEMVTEYGIELVSVDLVFGDEVYRDRIDIDPAKFYTFLRQAKKLPTTSGSLPEPFLEAYRRASRRADSIFCITVPSRLSGIYNSARLAVGMAKKALPGVAIEILDCSTAAAGQGFVVLAAARAAASGKSLAEVAKVARDVMPRVKLFAALDTLRYLVKGGRVPKAVALASSRLQIKPGFAIYNGDAHPVANARTARGSMNRILKLMGQEVVKGQPLHVAVMHADALDRARKFSDEISTRFDCAELFITFL